MDEIVEEKLKAMGYEAVPEELAKMLSEWKKRQDAVFPSPLSIDAIIMCVTLYEMRMAARRKAKDAQKE